jgi:hypothetical protein
LVVPVGVEGELAEEFTGAVAVIRTCRSWMSMRMRVPA